MTEHFYPCRRREAVTHVPATDTLPELTVSYTLASDIDGKHYAFCEVPGCTWHTLLDGTLLEWQAQKDVLTQHAHDEQAGAVEYQPAVFIGDPGTCVPGIECPCQPEPTVDWVGQFGNPLPVLVHATAMEPVHGVLGMRALNWFWEQHGH